MISSTIFIKVSFVLARHYLPLVILIVAHLTPPIQEIESAKAREITSSCGIPLGNMITKLRSIFDPTYFNLYSKRAYKKHKQKFLDY